MRENGEIYDKEILHKTSVLWVLRNCAIANVYMRVTQKREGGERKLITEIKISRKAFKYSFACI